MLADKITVMEATADHAALLVPRIRLADRKEIYAASGRRVEAKIFDALDHSDMAWSGWAGDTVHVIFGVARLSFAGTAAQPWLIASSGIEDHQIAFLRRCRRYARQMLTVADRLENFVDRRNHVAIDWLRWVGFTIDPEPAPYGPWGRPFLRFWMEAS